MAKSAASEPKRMSDAAVQAKTGKTWPEWFAIMDKAGCSKLNHKEIVAFLTTAHNVGSWWRQMITVAYEQARGLRDKHEKPSGYEISRSKTIGVPISAAFKAWSDARLRSRWLGKADLTIRKATENKSLRITWNDGGSNLEVMFYPKGADKCQVTVQHGKLPDAKAGERMKAYWGEALDRLAETLTG